MKNNRQLRSGQGVTLVVGSDCYPYTIVGVILYTTVLGIKALKVQRDQEIRVSGTDYDGSAVYRYEQDVSAPIEIATWSSRACRFLLSGHPLSVNGRRFYRDPSV